ncbi:MAG: hypothetical protein D3924_18680 [Candidatus Electrothrix sp. AR4]|nr:hypothetical protein [Candidatus Electrothrix sp. AR4]
MLNRGVPAILYPQFAHIFLQNTHRLIMELGVATLPVYLVCTIWAVFLADSILPFRLNAYGIVPRTTGGLFGIVCTNFLHADIGHIISNTVAICSEPAAGTVLPQDIF